jgi:hypothetical protein
MEIVGKVSVAAAAAFLASRYGARVAPRMHYDDPSEWGRPMESLTDVLRFIVSTSRIMDDPSSYDGTSDTRIDVEWRSGDRRNPFPASALDQNKQGSRRRQDAALCEGARVTHPHR